MTLDQPCQIPNSGYLMIPPGSVIHLRLIFGLNAEVRNHTQVQHLLRQCYPGLGPLNAATCFLIITAQHHRWVESTAQISAAPALTRGDLPHMVDEGASSMLLVAGHRWSSSSIKFLGTGHHGFRSSHSKCRCGRGADNRPARAMFIYSLFLIRGRATSMGRSMVET